MKLLKPLFLTLGLVAGLSARAEEPEFGIPVKVKVTESKGCSSYYSEDSEHTLLIKMGSAKISKDFDAIPRYNSSLIFKHGNDVKLWEGPAILRVELDVSKLTYSILFNPWEESSSGSSDTINCRVKFEAIDSAAYNVAVRMLELSAQ